jgi:formate hydrogenlyase subunit 3/multisubunit Na+/H+ antiporter MnhD subunit
MESSGPRGSTREKYLMLGVAVALVLLLAAVFLIVEGNSLIMDSNAQVASSNSGNPCHGPGVCLAPGIGQPEGQVGLHYIYVGVGLIVVSLIAVILIGRKARRLYSKRAEG